MSTHATYLSEQTSVALSKLLIVRITAVGRKYSHIDDKVLLLGHTAALMSAAATATV
jgi:hypothetical protein